MLLKIPEVDISQLEQRHQTIPKNYEEGRKSKGVYT